MWWDFYKLWTYGSPDYGLMYKKKSLGQKVEVKENDIEGAEEVKEEEIPRERNKEEGLGETGEIASPSP